MRIRRIRGRIVLAIVLVGCIPLVIGLGLAYVSGMQSLRDVIGGNLQAVAVQAADRVTMLVQGRYAMLGCWPRRHCACACLFRWPTRPCPPDQEKREALDRPPDRALGTRRRPCRLLLNGELSRFLLETKIRDGDKVIGLSDS